MSPPGSSSAPFLRRAAAILLLATAGCDGAALPLPGADARGPLILRPCVLLDVREYARCGTLEVPERRDRSGGRHLSLRVVVLPARSTPLPDPVVLLTGGPGMAAAEWPAYADRMLGDLRDRREIVLLDQRGTGRSAPLECELAPGASLQPLLDAPFEPAAVARCRRQLAATADLARFGTAHAADDLADLLDALGRRQANLFGVSYGTRAALVFLARHPGRVRTAALEGIVPPEKVIPLAGGWAGTRALDSAWRRCAAAAPCRAAVPDPSGDLRAAVERLARGPAHVRLWNWRRLRFEDDTIGARGFAERAREMLYDPGLAARLIPLVHAAAAGDWRPFARRAVAAGRARAEGRALGMQLAVLCASEAPRLARADLAGAAATNRLGLPLAAELVRACTGWPTDGVEPEDTLPVRSDVPVLLLSGARDPVTPPEWADSAAAGLPAAVHVVFPDQGHGFGGACIAGLIATLVRTGSARAVDPSCARPAALAAPPAAR